MHDVPGQRPFDKMTLIGACVRLGITVDAARLAAEVDALPQELWGTTGGRVGVQRSAEALFLRGYAPAEGDRPIEDRPTLGRLPYTRSIIEEQVPAAPLRCLLARLPGGASIAPHVDRGAYFAQTVRLHIAVSSHDRAFMHCAGECYVMRPGEVWALNNSVVHGVWNADASRARTHLIVDFLPSPALCALLAAGERTLGRRRSDVEAHFAALLAGQPAGRA